MEIEEYRAQFIDQLRFDADHEGTEPETQFILKTLEELETIPHFYMQSGICYEKMSFANKTLMKMMSNILSKKNGDDVEAGFAQAIKSSYDISSKEYAEPLIKFLLEVEEQ